VCGFRTEHADEGESDSYCDNSNGYGCKTLVMGVESRVCVMCVCGCVMCV
jgi:hypothetical protein